jgi:hypothetical protein
MEWPISLLKLGMEESVTSDLAELSGLDLEDLGWVSLLQEQEREDLNHSI